MINVLIVDDHHIVRNGVAGLLNDAGNIKVVAEATSGEEAVRLLSEGKCKPDVVLMDLQMPGIGGVEAACRMLENNSNLKILILTVFSNDVFLARLLEAGISGYLTKGVSAKEMIRAVRAVHSGKRYICSELPQKMATTRRLAHVAQDDPFSKLSQRERQVMMLTVKGKTSKEIERELKINANNINVHRHRMFDKLGVKSDVELTYLALAHGTIENIMAGKVDD